MAFVEQEQERREVVELKNVGDSICGKIVRIRPSKTKMGTCEYIDIDCADERTGKLTGRKVSTMFRPAMNQLNLWENTGRVAKLEFSEIAKNATTGRQYFKFKLYLWD